MLRKTVRHIWVVTVATVIVIAVVTTLTRFLLPLVAQYRTDIEAALAAALGQPVTIGELSADWRGAHPTLRLTDVVLLNRETEKPSFNFAEVFVSLDVARSVLHGRPEPAVITLVGVDLELTRDSETGAFSAENLTARGGGGLAQSGKKVSDWLFSREKIVLEKTVLRLKDASLGSEPLVFSDVTLRLNNLGNQHELQAHVTLPEQLGSDLVLGLSGRGDVNDFATWNFDFYVHGQGLQPAAWLRNLAWNKISVRSGTLEVEAWGHIQDGRVVSVSGQLQLNNARLTLTDNPYNLHDWQVDGLSSRVFWRQPEADGWSLVLNQFEPNFKNRRWTPANVQLDKIPQGDQTQYKFAASTLVVDDLAMGWLVAGLGSTEFGEAVQALRPEGQLRSVYADLLTRQENEPLVNIRGRLQDVGWRPWKKVPGVSGVDGLFEANNQQARLQLDSRDSRLTMPNLFKDPIAFKSLAGIVSAQQRDAKDPGSWSIWSDNIAAANRDIELEGNFELRLGDEDSPSIDLAAFYRNGNGAAVSRYLPVGIMKPKLIDWLQQSIVGGRVADGGVVLRGPLKKFPFRQNEGRFEVTFDVERGVLRHTPGWPRIDNIDAQVSFNETTMEITGRAGKIFGADIYDTAVSIADMTDHDHRSVKISGHAAGPGADGLRYLRESPLVNTAGAFTKDMEAEGNVKLDLQLDIPIHEGGGKAAVDGTVHLSGNNLRLVNANVDINAIQGDFGFTHAGLAAKGIRATLLGQSATVDIVTQQGGEDQRPVTIFSARGESTVEALKQRFPVYLFDYCRGPFLWQGSLRVANRDNAPTVDLTISSPLKQVVVDLPAPLTKPAGRPTQVVVRLPIVPAQPMRIDYGDKVAIALEFAKDSKHGSYVKRGDIRYGAGEPQLPDLDVISINANISELDVGDWLDKRPPPSQRSTVTPAAPLSIVDIRAKKLTYLSKPFTSAAVAARSTNDGWRIQVDSPDASGTGFVPSANGKPIRFEFGTLSLVAPPEDGRPEPAAQQQGVVDPRRIPPLIISAQRFRYGDWSLGRMSLETQPSPQGMEFTQVNLVRGGTQIRAHGHWSQQAGIDKTSIDVNLESADMGETLDVFGYAGALKGGRGKNGAQVSWDGPPRAFSLERINGAISLNITDGRLLDVDPGAGRIFGLLSLQTLPRRLSLDFSDLFSKGFAFDIIRGGFAVKNGMAFTDNFYMDGPAAKIQVAGYIDLPNHTYDQRVKVIPHITSSLPLAIGVIASPLAGAATWIAEQLFRDPVGEFTQANYRVLGKWESPLVEPMTRGELAQEEAKDGLRPLPQRR